MVVGLTVGMWHRAVASLAIYCCCWGKEGGSEEGEGVSEGGNRYHYHQLANGENRSSQETTNKDLQCTSYDLDL